MNVVGLPPRDADLWHAGAHGQGVAWRTRL